MRLARAQRLTGIGRHNCGATLLIHEIAFTAFAGGFGPSKLGGVAGVSPVVDSSAAAPRAAG